MNDFVKFIKIRDMYFQLAFFLILMSCFSGYLLFSGKNKVPTLLLLIFSIGAFVFCRNKINVLKEQWHKRDIVKNILAGGGSRLLSILFALEQDGYPVYEVVHTHGRIGLMDEYEQYLIQTYQRLCMVKLYSGATSSLATKASNQLEALMALETFGQIEAERFEMSLS